MFRPSLLRAGLLCGGLALAAGAPVRTVEGVALNPFRPGGAVGLLFFVLTDCPISNSYAPEIQRICKQYAGKGVSCTLVYEDAKIQANAVRQHMKDYGHAGANLAAVIDADRAIAHQAHASVTPEAALIDSKGRLQYHGRIDNFYAALGKTRRNVTEHDLTDAIDAVLAGKAVAYPETKPLGCFITPADL